MLSITSPSQKTSVEGGSRTRIEMILAALSTPHGCQFRHPDKKIKNTDGESRTRNNLSLNQVPLPFGYVGVKNQIKAGSRNRTDEKQSCSLSPKSIWLYPHFKVVKSARRDSNPQQLEWKSRVQPLNFTREKICLQKTSGAGFEPAYFALEPQGFNPLS